MGDGRGNNRVVGRGCQADLKCPSRIQCWSLLGGGGHPCVTGALPSASSQQVCSLLLLLLTTARQSSLTRPGLFVCPFLQIFSHK